MKSTERVRQRGKAEGYSYSQQSLIDCLCGGRFAERHRRLVNVLIQQNVQLLLEGPLTQLMRTPRLIDFDNKRAFFRSQVRSSSDRYHGSLRIHVRREHIFEDSFHQLRSKCALLPIAGVYSTAAVHSSYLLSASSFMLHIFRCLQQSCQLQCVRRPAGSYSACEL